MSQTNKLNIQNLMNILNDHYLNYLSKNVVSVLLAGALTGFGPGGGGGIGA